MSQQSFIYPQPFLLENFLVKCILNPSRPNSVSFLPGGFLASSNSSLTQLSFLWVPTCILGSVCRLSCITYVHKSISPIIYAFGSRNSILLLLNNSGPIMYPAQSICLIPGIDFLSLYYQCFGLEQ